MATERMDELLVDFLPQRELNLAGRIGLTEAPGRKDAGHARDLDADLKRLRQDYRVDVLVTLLERGQYVRDELSALKIPELLVRAQRHGLDSEWWPTPDGGVPVSLDRLLALVERILLRVRLGKIVVIHCREGLGRSGLVAACCLTAVGAAVDEALEVVRAVRPGAVETAAQHQCLRAFDELWRRRALERASPGAISTPFMAEDSSSAEHARISSTGLAPLSHPGAATLAYLGLTEVASAAGVAPGAPLREGDLFHVTPGTVAWLGRGKECDITIASSQLSRRHAMLAFVAAVDRKLVLVDADSRNGLCVDRRERKVCFLGLGDEFALARAYRFRFESIG
jgi:hypothetical protein